MPDEVTVTTCRAVCPNDSLPKSTRAGDAPSVQVGCGPGNATPLPVSCTCFDAQTGQSSATALEAGPAAVGANETVTVVACFGSSRPRSPCGEMAKSEVSSAGSASTLSATGEVLVTWKVSVFCEPTATSPKSSRSGSVSSRGW